MISPRDVPLPLSQRAHKVLLEARKLQGLDANKTGDGIVFPNPSDKPYSDMVFTQLMRRMERP